MRYRFLRFPEGKTKAVTLSYDDGFKSDIRLSELITKYGLKCTFNFNCEEMHGFSFTKSEIEEYFLSRGHEIAVHGANHRAEGVLRPVEGITDILECRRELENKLGIIIRGMAYPDSGIRFFANGASYDHIKNYLKDLDIVYARTLGKDNNLFNLPEDWHEWVPTAHHKNPELKRFIDEFIELKVFAGPIISRRAPKLFYLWGHSHEFDRDDNWCLMEEICEKLSGHDDIWYATNMEIYKYVKAYEALEYSADGTIIHNPTLYDIWFDVDSKLYKISSGETIHL